MYGYIYKTTDLRNNKIYVGQHKSDKFDTKYYGSGIKISKLIKKYGVERFTCELLEKCDSAEQLNKKEIYWIDKLNCLDDSIGYNIATGGAGYYSAENIEKRREEAHKAKMMEKRAEICEQYDKIIRNAETDKKVMLCVFDYGLSTDNVIYYNHTNTLSFNWRDYGEKITREEFDDFVNNVDRFQLPEGIKFELK